MAIPPLVCVLEGSGDPIFSAINLDHRFIEGDRFKHTTGGVTTQYRVESAILDVVAMVGDPATTTTWTQFVLRVTVSVVP